MRCLGTHIVGKEITDQLLHIFPYTGIKSMHLRIHIGHIECLSISILTVNSILRSYDVTTIISTFAKLIANRWLAISIYIRVFLERIPTPFLTHPSSTFPLLSGPFFLIIRLADLIAAPSWRLLIQIVVSGIGYAIVSRSANEHNISRSSIRHNLREFQPCCFCWNRSRNHILIRIRIFQRALVITITAARRESQQEAQGKKIKPFCLHNYN